MTHNEYIAEIQYKIDSLFYEYNNIEMYKYQNYDYYNEYTNFNHYDTLMLEAEEKKGIIRRIIDGIIKIIRTAIDKVKSFFSKNNKIDKNAEVKVNKNLVNRINIFKKKSAKLKIGFTILATALGAIGAPIIIPKVSSHMYKRANNSEEESLIKTKGYDDKLSKIGTEIRDINTGETIKPDDPKYAKLIRVGELTIEIHQITKALEGVNKDLEGILSKNPEDIGKSEKEFIKEVNNLSIEGSKLLDEMMTILNEANADDITTKTKKILDKYDTEKDKYNKLQGKVADRVGNTGQQGNTKLKSMTSIEGAQDIMMDMSISIGQIQAIIINDLKSAISRCDDQELNTLAKNCVFKCKKLADWCMRHAYITTDYTENDYDKQHTSCKNDYVAIKSMEVSSDGSRVVNLVKKVNDHLNDVHNGAKQLHTMWEKNNK